MQATFHTRIDTDLGLGTILNAIAELYNELERKLFVDLYIHRRPLNDCKREYIAAYRITARQFNAIASEVRAKAKAALENRRAEVKSLQERIMATEKAIRKLEKEDAALARGKGKHKELAPHERSARRHRVCFLIHMKKRRLAVLNDRLAALKSAGEIPSICFGSRRLFYAQWHLEENGYTSHAEWLRDWQDTRSNSFFCLGSKDETKGNQTCELLPGGVLRLRLPHALESTYGKYVHIAGVRFPYGQDVIDNALIAKQAISYRFVRRDGVWHVHATTERAPAKVVTNRMAGAIGVDLNPALVAIAEVDRFGNPIDEHNIALLIQGRRQDQVLAALGDAVTKVVAIAKRTGKPIVVEDLDFRRKKARLREESHHYARMLSSFAYTRFYVLLLARAEREGVEVITVNPACTSVIGKVKFMSRYGLSAHASAAVAIARRGLKFGERLRAGTALALPARNRARHVWSDWRLLLPVVCSRQATHELYGVSQRKTQAGCSLSISAPADQKPQGPSWDRMAWVPG